jgi:predicted RND superfamily exporter protein
MKNSRWNSQLEIAYRFRWIVAVASLLAVGLAMSTGVGRILDFSSRVEAMKETPDAKPAPRMFDMRTDIWFDPQDEGLAAYRDIEDQFIAEDVILIAFEDQKDPWGVFGTDALENIASLSRAIEKVPYVRAVRSLTGSPWIRWAEIAPGEEGLVVNDFFDKPIASYSKEERLERMIAILGAKRAAALAGDDAVRGVIGKDAKYEDHIGEPRFIDGIVSADGRTAAISVQVLRQKPTAEQMDAHFDADDETGRAIGPLLHSIESQGVALKEIRRIVGEHERYELHIAGIPVLEQHFPEVGEGDMAFVGLMFLLIGGMLFFVFRRVSGVVIPLVVVQATIMGMLGAVWISGDLLNNMTATAPVVMTAVGIADAVHLVTTYFLLRPRFSEKRPLIIAMIERNALPVLLTSVTTAVAFFSLTVSDIVPVRMFGYTAGIGTVLAYLLSMTVIPALLSLVPMPKKSKETPVVETSEDDVPHWSDPLLDFVFRHRAKVLAGAAFTVALSAFGMSRVAVESDMRMMFPEDDPVPADIRWIEARLGGAGDLDIVFYGPTLDDDSAAVFERQKRIESLLMEEEIGASQKAELKTLEAAEAEHQRRRIAASSIFLQQVDAFERRVVEESKDPKSPLAVLTSFDSGLSVLRRMHMVQNENAASHYRVPNEKDVDPDARTTRVVEDDVTGELEMFPAQNASTLSAQYFLQYENGAKPTQNLASLVTQDRRGFRIAARVANAPSRELLGTYERIRTIAREEFPMLQGSATAVASGDALSTMRMSGKHFLFVNMMEKFSETLIISMLMALALITLIIVVAFRSLKIGLISMIPNVLPLVVPLGFLGLLGIPIDGPAVIVATVALGVCVDDTIHLLSKFRDGRDKGLDPEAALRYAFRRVGSALTWTTIVLVVGFGALTFSAFRPNMMIGALGAIMVLLAWVADLVVTPVALSYLDRKPARVAVPTPAVAT